MTAIARNRSTALAAALLAATLVACAQRGAPPAAQGYAPAVAKQAPQDDVYPSMLRGTQSVELGELVLMLMPRSGQETRWDFLANSIIQWQTTGYDTYPGADGGAYRRGWVRVNILGAKATALRQRKVELGWTVELDRDSSEGLAGIRSGPNEISIEPGGVGSDDQCFGAEFDGCDFDAPVDSVAIARIHVQPICAEFGPGGQKDAFLLTYPRRLPIVMVWERSGGSGGDSSDIKLILDASSKVPPPPAASGYNPQINAFSYVDQHYCAA